VETQQAKAPASNSSGIAPVNRQSFTARLGAFESLLGLVFLGHRIRVGHGKDGHSRA